MADEIKIKNIPSAVKIHRPDPSKDSKYTARSHIYVRAVKGAFTSLRRRMNIVFMLAFFLTPWIQFNGHQAVLFDLAEQRFHIFGLTLWPQDLTLLAWILMIAAFALFFVTTFLGRVWCGYLCPQTVWTFIFIWFEERFEGSANQRKKLDQSAVNFNKIWRKSAKHLCWVGFALLTALTFVGYFTEMDQLVVNTFTFNLPFMYGFWIIFFTICTYGNAGWMREIMCTHMCPYARFQSAMFDKDTFTVTYNQARGENRGPRSRKQDPKEMGLGDCIDCNLCVQVCPTGIDIRNGLQYECINCGACVDACNDVMAKMNYPANLISYTTEHAVKGQKTKILRFKFVGYGAVLLVMIALLSADLITRKPMALDIIRDRNMLARETKEGLIENVYTLKIMNKTQQQQTYAIRIEGLDNVRWNGPKQITIQAGAIESVPISCAVDPYDLSQAMTDVEFILSSEDENGQLIEVKEQSRFFNQF